MRWVAAVLYLFLASVCVWEAAQPHSESGWLVAFLVLGALNMGAALVSVAFIGACDD